MCRQLPQVTRGCHHNNVSGEHALEDGLSLAPRGLIFDARIDEGSASGEQNHSLSLTALSDEDVFTLLECLDIIGVAEFYFQDDQVRFTSDTKIRTGSF